MDKDQLTEKLKIFFPALGLGLVLILGGLRLLGAIAENASNFGKNKLRWENEAKDYRTKVNYFSAVDQDRIRQMETILNEAVFKQDKSYYLVGVIQKIAEEYGFVIDSFQAQVGEIGQGKIVSKVDTVNLEIKVKLIGPKERYLELVTRLEKTLPVLSIENFEIKAISNVVGIEANISAFFIPKTGEANIENLELTDLALTEKETSLIGELEKYQKYSGMNTDAAITSFTNFGKTNPFQP